MARDDIKQDDVKKNKYQFPNRHRTGIHENLKLSKQSITSSYTSKLSKRH